MEVSAIAAFTALSVLLGIEIVHGMSKLEGAFWLPLPLTMAAYLAADFVSGFVHFLADTFGTVDTPFVGPKFVKNFRDHHTDPKGITRHDFVETNGDNCLVSLSCLVPCYFFVPVSSELWALGLGIFTLTMMLFVLLTNQLHKWAHTDSPPRLVAALQSWGIVLSPDHHDVHHVAPHERNYCITCGWLNPILESIRFFPRSEIVLRTMWRWIFGTTATATDKPILP